MQPLASPLLFPWETPMANFGPQELPTRWDTNAQPGARVLPQFPRDPLEELGRRQPAQLPRALWATRQVGMGGMKLPHLGESSLVCSVLRNTQGTRFFLSMSCRFAVEHCFCPARWDGRAETSSSHLAPSLSLCFPAGLPIKMSMRSSSSTSPSSCSSCPSPVASFSTPGESGLDAGQRSPPRAPCVLLSHPRAEEEILTKALATAWEVGWLLWLLWSRCGHFGWWRSRSPCSQGGWASCSDCCLCSCVPSTGALVLLPPLHPALLPTRVTDAVFNFLLVWYYCTLTIRESILINNGSK